MAAVVQVEDLGEVAELVCARAAVEPDLLERGGAAGKPAEPPDAVCVGRGAERGAPGGFGSRATDRTSAVGRPPPSVSSSRKKA